ncbi:hypothetical protein LCGC14_1848030 [marine sediment metagenome]|uniref:Uncharacterized protein n=1 Tax=marine sediment metagenome TaxID=412755 RepID=A0A0F9IQS7_9ZZZZ
MIHPTTLLAGLLALVPVIAAAQDRTFTLAVPEALVASGLIDHLRPRFSLKTGITMRVVAQGADLSLVAGGDGVPVLRGPAGLYSLTGGTTDPEARRFADWLASDTRPASRRNPRPRPPCPRATRPPGPICR